MRTLDVDAIQAQDATLVMVFTANHAEPQMYHRIFTIFSKLFDAPRTIATF
jgi:hypothetical protein